MSQKSSSQILPLLEVGSEIQIKAFEDVKQVLSATVTDVFEDGFSAMAEDDFYIEMYDDKIDELVTLKIIG